MALPKVGQVGAQVPSFTPAQESTDETGRGKSFDSPNAEAAAERQFISASEARSKSRQLEPSKAEIMRALDRALRCVIEATSANYGGLLIMDESSRDLVFALARGGAPENGLHWQWIPAGRGVAHRAATHWRAAMVNSTSNDEPIHTGIDVADGFRNRSLVAAPLSDGDELLGVIEVLNKKNGEFFSPSDQHHLNLMAHLVSPLLRQLRDRQAEKLVEQ